MASFYSFCVCAGTATSLRCKRQRVTAKWCSGSLLIFLKEHDAIYLDFVSGGAAIKGLVAADFVRHLRCLSRLEGREGYASISGMIARY